MATNNYAIVVGIDEYHEKPLEGAVGDAVDFAQWLIDSGEIPRQQTTQEQRLKLIVSKDYPNEKDPPTDREINRAVKEIYTEIKKTNERGKRLYFYFAGHGLGLTYTNTALCMRPWTSFFNLDCISTTKYLDGLAQLDLFEEIFFFVDCCRDADVLAEGLGPLWKQPRMQAVNTKYLICFATKYGERSQEVAIDLSRRRGAFTTFLLRALKGDASNGQGEVRALDLIKHMEDHFKSYTSTLNYVQEVDVNTNLGGNNVLITRVSGAPLPYNCEITFRRDSDDVELLDNNLAKIKSGPVAKGQKWQVKLPIGISVLTDKHVALGSNGREKFIRNHSLNTVSYEQF